MKRHCRFYGKPTHNYSSVNRRKARNPVVREWSEHVILVLKANGSIFFLSRVDIFTLRENEKFYLVFLP